MFASAPMASILPSVLASPCVVFVVKVSWRLSMLCVCVSWRLPPVVSHARVCMSVRMCTVVCVCARARAHSRIIDRERCVCVEEGSLGVRARAMVSTSPPLRAHVPSTPSHAARWRAVQPHLPMWWSVDRYSGSPSGPVIPCACACPNECGGGGDNRDALPRAATPTGTRRKETNLVEVDALFADGRAEAKLCIVPVFAVVLYRDRVTAAVCPVPRPPLTHRCTLARGGVQYGCSIPLVVVTAPAKRQQSRVRRGRKARRCLRRQIRHARNFCAHADNRMGQLRPATQPYVSAACVCAHVQQACRQRHELEQSVHESSRARRFVARCSGCPGGRVGELSDPASPSRRRKPGPNQGRSPCLSSLSTLHPQAHARRQL